jgi:hypothetical protein
MIQYGWTTLDWPTGATKFATVIFHITSKIAETSVAYGEFVGGVGSNQRAKEGKHGG